MGETADSGKNEAIGKRRTYMKRKRNMVMQKKKKDKDGKSREGQRNGGKEKKNNHMDNMDARKLKLKHAKIDIKMKDLVAKIEEILNQRSKAGKSATNLTEEAAPTPSF
ncbi:hypothetical protein PVL29_018530 [Vitis rotundifolia]|uniref:Uncharacterized protein n=1 Tax=Vitis rotundifolia TaxID=103349 RepID=A0AA38Z5G0_VITRO|nr:hypothetical protein PVL29_018530 [Vitis rotundifolia]